MAKTASRANPNRAKAAPAQKRARREPAPKGTKPRSVRTKPLPAPAKGGAAQKQRTKKTQARRPKKTPATADKRIDRAVAFINKRAKMISDQIIAIGKYLLREFFDNDPAAVTSKDPGKMNSFRDLAGRPDCVLSHLTLWRAVNLAIQERKFGTVSAMKQLTSTHKIALLEVDNPKEKQYLAKEAAAGSWSTRELRTEIRRRAKVVTKKEQKRGGAPIALAEGSLKHVAKAAKTGALSPAHLPALPKARVGRLVTLMEEVIKLLVRSAKAGRQITGIPQREPAEPES